MRDNGTLMPVSLATVLEPGPRRFVIEDLIPEGDTSILYGDGGQGKSFLALYFGTCVATGTAVLDQKVERSNVLYLDGSSQRTNSPGAYTNWPKAWTLTWTLTVINSYLHEHAYSGINN